MGDDLNAWDGTGRFPTTHWSMLQDVRDPQNPKRLEVYNCLIRRYWKPAYVYVCRRGHTNDAADLTQDFFLYWFEKEVFAKADPDRGRFRTFLLACLKRFLVDAHRREQREQPPEGIVSIQQLAAEDGPNIDPSDAKTAEDAYDRAWVREVLHHVCGTLKREFTESGQEVHYELFRRRVYEPIMDGGAPPSMEELAREYDIPSRKEACNRLITARRAFQRLVREEIRVYASSEEEIASEVQDLFRFAAGS